MRTVTLRLVVGLGAALTLSAHNPAGAQAAEPLPGGGWTMVTLDLDVHLHPEEERAVFEGVATLRLDEERSDGPGLLVGYNDAIVEWTRLEGAAGGEAALNLPLTVAPGGRLARLMLAAPAQRGDELEVRFAYESTGRAFQFVVASNAACASWVSSWTPAALPVTEEGLSPALLKHPGVTRFHMPAEWRSVSNGARASREVAGGRAIETWRVDRPVARSFAAGPYTMAEHRVGGRRIGVYLLSEKALSVEAQVEQLAAALTAQEARFGAYPYPTYAIAEIPESLIEWYASSEQGFIMAASSAFDVAHGNLPLWAHEMAHGWWGNLVSSTGSGGIWLNESLAQYSAVIAIESVEGVEEAAEFLEYSRSGYNPIQCAAGYFLMWRRGQDRALSECDGEDSWEHNLSDAKGHWVYHMLRRRIGDEAFFGALRGVVERSGAGPLTVDEMRARFIEAAPGADLESFFAQWLGRTGAPVLDLDWWGDIEDGQRRVHLEITQTQGGEPFVTPLEIEVALMDGATRRFRVELTERAQAFTLDVDDRPMDVRLDPDRALLMWRPEYGPRPGDPVSD